MNRREVLTLVGGAATIKGNGKVVQIVGLLED
jgi:hypothetical protein